MKQLVQTILEDCRPYIAEGHLASYIPELANADLNDIGMYVYDKDGQADMGGDWQKRFTIQSICKPILLLLAVKDNGIDFVKEHVGVEATGKPFNAIDYSEHVLLREHINPMVNIGAIAVCNLIKGDSQRDRLNRLISFTSKITANPEIEIDHSVFESERATGNKNKALGYLLKSSGIITGNVEDLLDVYFAMCSLKVNCKDLANMGLLLANHGKTLDGEQILSAEETRFINAILTISGMYDGSGDFATTVGIPAKSGVGGGIMSVVPGRMGIGIYSPALDKKGNSVAGIKMLEQLSKELDLSIF